MQRGGEKYTMLTVIKKVVAILISDREDYIARNVIMDRDIT